MLQHGAWRKYGEIVDTSLQQVSDEARQRRSGSCSQNTFAGAQQLGRRSKVGPQQPEDRSAPEHACVVPGGLAVVLVKRGCYVLDFPIGDVTSIELQNVEI